MSKALTPAERVAKHAAANDIKRVPLNGKARERLAALKAEQSLKSMSETVNYALDRLANLEKLER